MEEEENAARPPLPPPRMKLDGKTREGRPFWPCCCGEMRRRGGRDRLSPDGREWRRGGGSGRRRGWNGWAVGANKGEHTHTRKSALRRERGKGGGVDLRWRVCLLSRAKGGRGEGGHHQRGLVVQGRRQREKGRRRDPRGRGRREALSHSFSLTHTLSLSPPPLLC